MATDVVGDDPDNWADNGIGCYCRFVQKFLGLGYRVLLVQPWTTSGEDADLEETNAAIKQVAERFGVATVKAPVSTKLEFHYYPDLSNRNRVHYNDLGYAWFAGALVSAVANLPGNETKYLIPAG